jgi:hypothetical protein
VTAPGKIGFDDDGHPVGVTEFNFDALEADAQRRDYEDAIRYQRDKLAEFVRFTCDALLAGNPSAEIAGRRAYFFALLLKQPPFASQSELARHLGLTEGRISQQLKAFKRENPLFLALNGE